MNGDIKSIVKEFKEANGNKSFSQKEMLIYCINRLDKVYDKLEVGSSKIANNRAGLRFIYWLNGIGIPVLLSVLAYLFLQVIRIK